MLRSKFFWIAVSLIVPFIVVWVMEGLLWAIATYFIVGAFLLIAMTSARRRRAIYYYDEDDIVFRRTQRRPSDIERGAKWHIPTANQNGVEFITGAKGMKKSQEDAMRRTKKRFWG